MFYHLIRFPYCGTSSLLAVTLLCVTLQNLLDKFMSSTQTDHSLPEYHLFIWRSTNSDQCISSLTIQMITLILLSAGFSFYHLNWCMICDTSEKNVQFKWGDITNSLSALWRGEKKHLQAGKGASTSTKTGVQMDIHNREELMSFSF